MGGSRISENQMVLLWFGGDGPALRTYLEVPAGGIMAHGPVLLQPGCPKLI